MFYLPFNLPKYPPTIEIKILDYITREVDESDGEALIGFHLKELSLNRSIQLAYKIKESRGEKVKLVAGGTYATTESSNLLSIFDYVVVGSGEGILKILERRNVNSIVKNPPREFEYPMFTNCWVLNEHGDIESDRFRSLIHPQYKNHKALEIVLGSGCSHSCSYCEVASQRRIFGKNYRIKFAEPEPAVDLIKHEIELNPEIQYIYFFDEDFLLKPTNWIINFVSLYKRKINLPFFIFATPSSVSKFPHKLITLSKGTLDMINMGIQSGSEATTNNLFNRKESKNQIITCVNFLVRLYLKGKTTSPPMLDFIILNPYETSDRISETIELIEKLSTPFKAAMHCMSFFKGTPLHKKAVDEGIIPLDYRVRNDLHDFMRRIKENEFRLDYSKEESLQWLFLNTLLYGMYGLHQEIRGERRFGNLSEKRFNKLKKISKPVYRDIISLAGTFPNPMDRIEILKENLCEFISK